MISYNIDDYGTLSIFVDDKLYHTVDDCLYWGDYEIRQYVVDEVISYIIDDCRRELSYFISKSNCTTLDKYDYARMDELEDVLEYYNQYSADEYTIE